MVRRALGPGRCSKRFSGLAFPWKVAPFSSPRFSFSEKPSRDFLETDVVRWISYRCDATSCSSVCGKVHQKDSEYSVRAFRLQVFFARSVANASAFSWRMQAASESQSAGNDWQLRECWKNISGFPANLVDNIKYPRFSNVLRFRTKNCWKFQIMIVEKLEKS